MTALAPIAVTCPSCAAQLAAPGYAAGLTAKCSKCRHRVAVPADNLKPTDLPPAVAPRMRCEAVLGWAGLVTLVGFVGAHVWTELTRSWDGRARTIVLLTGVVALVLLAGRAVAVGLRRLPTGPPSGTASRPACESGRLSRSRWPVVRDR
jgi:hypothetical protein